MHKVLTAIHAKWLTTTANKSGLNHQRRKVLAAIENAARSGDLHVVLDDNLGAILKEEDYKFFEVQGYQVHRPSVKQGLYELAIISWE